MATASQQLVDDYEQLQSTLELYPNVTIVSAEGQPPDNYEIEYAIRGYVKQSDGSIEVGSNHKISVSLPFGYPHFAPSIKPLTPIFHPDIDPAAIRIADRWEQNPSLADLVLYIGEMICGSIYNLEDPFNQDAAEWYQQNLAKLPLDSLSLADIEEVGDDFDSLVDDTFASLGLEDDEFLEPAKKFKEADISRVRELIAKNHIFTANKILIEVPETAEIPDREELQQIISKALRKSDQLIKLAEQLEDMGKLDEALEVVDNLFEVAADSPDADRLRTRIQQSYTIASSLEKESSPSLEETPLDIQEEELTEPPPIPKRDKPRKTKKRNLPGIPFKLIITAAAILGLSVGSISLYFKDQNSLSRTQASLLKSQLLIDKRQFDDAQESLDAARTYLEGLTILRYKKGKLDQEINTMLNSKELREGLLGKVLYQGEYIPLTMAESLKELTFLTDQANSLADADKISEALTMYRQARQFAFNERLVEQQKTIAETIKALELKYALSLAQEAELSKDWQEAAETYRKALQITGDLSDPETANDITERLTAASFRHELDQSKKAFTQSQWQETIETLENAQKLINENPEVVSEKERQDLHRLLVNSQLYRLLSQARMASEKKDWTQAIDTYQKALSLLDRESANFDGVLGNSIEKIKKTLLMVRIAHIRDSVIIAEGHEDLNEVLKYNQQMQALIQKSAFKNDPEVQAVSKKIAEQVALYQGKIAFNAKISWLKEHYEEIFRENYPTFRGSRLVSPQVTFLKKVDSKSIFTITCIERSQGSSSRLEINYMYDSATGKWAVYHAQ